MPIKNAPHSPASFINVIHETGTKAEAVEWLQKTWNERVQLERNNEELLNALQGLMNYVGGWDSPADHPCGIARDLIAKAQA